MNYILPSSFYLMEVNTNFSKKIHETINKGSAFCFLMLHSILTHVPVRGRHASSLRCSCRTVPGPMLRAVLMNETAAIINSNCIVGFCCSCALCKETTVFVVFALLLLLLSLWRGMRHVMEIRNNVGAVFN